MATKPWQIALIAFAVAMAIDIVGQPQIGIRVLYMCQVYVSQAHREPAQPPRLEAKCALAALINLQAFQIFEALSGTIACSLYLA